MSSLGSSVGESSALPLPPLDPEVSVWVVQSLAADEARPLSSATNPLTPRSIGWPTYVSPAPRDEPAVPASRRNIFAID